MRNEMSILSNLVFTDECLDKNETLSGSLDLQQSCRQARRAKRE